jgi:hypothetical protein
VDIQLFMNAKSSIVNDDSDLDGSFCTIIIIVSRSNNLLFFINIILFSFIYTSLLLGTLEQKR